MTRTPIEAARQLFIKAEHDLIAAEKLLRGGPLDVACFHAHQAVEKYLKAYLQANALEFPRTHDLDALLDLLLQVTDLFEGYRAQLEPFLSYAVQLRYEVEYEPTASEATVSVDTSRAEREVLIAAVPQLS